MNRVVKLIAYILVTIFAFVLILPILWMVVGAFKTTPDFLKKAPEILPEIWKLDNFKRLFTFPVLQWMMNSFFVATITSLAVIIISTTAGYAFAIKIKKGAEPVFWILMCSMMIPATGTMVPTYVLISNLGLVDRLAGLIIPGMFSIVYIFFYRQYVRDIPTEIIDVADIDGAGEIQKFVRIILPLSKPAVITMFLLTFIGKFNGYMWPLIILMSENKWTLPLGTQRILLNDQLQRIQGLPNYGLQSAAGLFLLIPMVLVFTIGHKYFVKGLWGGGNKG